jgi:hypothetical protein
MKRNKLTVCKVYILAFLTPKWLDVYSCETLRTLLLLRLLMLLLLLLLLVLRLLLTPTWIQEQCSLNKTGTRSA